MEEMNERMKVSKPTVIHDLIWTWRFLRKNCGPQKFERGTWKGDKGVWQGHGRGHRTILASLSLHVKIAGEICIFNVKIADQKFGKGEGMKRDRMGRTREDTGEDTGTLSGWRGIAGRVSRFWGRKTD